ncbi:hypothetical protein ACFY05_39830 [Microtetraspora fusca]|uniref:Uncharacterized protein n=1 Tax=Microtetraspora fusca TaxID=1997 RepID=A0ABW6VI23_MICFU
METLESLIRRNARTSRQRYDTAAGEVISQLDKVHRLTSNTLQAVTYTQAFHVWWDMVLMQADKYDVEIDQALGIVRAWAANYLTNEPTPTVPDLAGQPACAVPEDSDAPAAALFERALTLTGRAAARRFLSATAPDGQAVS